MVRASANSFDHVREVTLGAYSHQDLPFEKLVEELRPERSLSHSPLFQVWFVLQNTPAANVELPGLTLSVLGGETGTAKFDLMMAMREDEHGLVGVIEYNSELFEAATINAMAGHFETLLNGMAADPEQPISQLPLLTDAERQQLLVAFNNTASPYPSDACIHHLFQAQAHQLPDRIALIYQGHCISYGHLNRLSNRLAHRLIASGVAADSVVAICCDRSLPMVISLLAVLKAGAAYLPLDPSYPQERLSFMLDDSGCALLLSEAKYADQFSGSGKRVISLGSELLEGASGNEEDPVTGVCEENLAYLLYTSGSTGAPKGVMIQHRGLVNYLSWCVKAYQVADGYGAPVHSPLGFDLTVTSLFSPLLSGRSVVLIPEAENFEGLSSALRNQNNFSLVKITPSHLEILERLVPADRLDQSTRALIIGGEALSGEHLTFWRSHAPGTRIINEYGPTETVVGCCVYEVPAGEPASREYTDRPAHSQHSDIPARSTPPACSPSRPRTTPHRRRRTGQRLF